MKKTTIILICLLTLTVLMSGLISGVSTNTNEKNSCLRDCSNQKLTDKKICLTDFNDDIKVCSNTYSTCFFNAKANKTAERLSKIKVCQKEYLSCKKGAVDLKNSCIGNITLNYKKCLETCNNENNDVCSMEYRPVCGKLNIACFKAPCPEIQKTFSNLCKMNKAGAILLYEGECKTGDSSQTK